MDEIVFIVCNKSLLLIVVITNIITVVMIIHKKIQHIMIFLFLIYLEYPYDAL